MSPLLTAYDDHLYNVEKELKIAHLEIHHLNDFIRQLSAENEIYQDKLDLKTREFAKLVSETIKNSNVLENYEFERHELDKRNALLSEENQILFDQVNMLKAHFDTFNQDYSFKVQDADQKIAAFDKLHDQHEELLHQHEQASRQKSYLEIKLKETSSMLGSIEENRRHEIHELQKLREERTVILKELDFYKDQAERLSNSLKTFKDDQDY